MAGMTGTGVATGPLATTGHPELTTTGLQRRTSSRRHIMSNEAEILATGPLATVRHRDHPELAAVGVKPGHGVTP